MLKLFSLLLTFAFAQPLLADAVQPVANLWRAHLEATFRDGLTPEQLKLRLVFDYPADRAFVDAHPAGRDLVKPRAFERLPHGYRVTWPDGRVADVRVDDRGVLLNEARIPGRAAGLSKVWTTLERALARGRVAGQFSFGLPRAEAASVDLTNAVVMLSVFTVTVLERSAQKNGNPPLVTDLIEHGAALCERENFENFPFRASQTARLLDQLSAFSTVDYTQAATADECRDKIKRALAKNKADAKALGVGPDDLMNGCESAARLSTCVREYRARVLNPPVDRPCVTDCGKGSRAGW